METTLEVATASMWSVEKVVKALGATITEKYSTPGTVGYTTITVSK